MKVLDLFAGIGGFSLAAHWMGWETVAFVERDKFCQKVLAKNFPGVSIYDDIREYRGDEHPADIVCGGFPCQPFSVAGKRKGTSDERHLWPEMLRVITAVRPHYVVGENVFGLISWSGGLVFESVQSDLEAAGYEVWAGVLPAAGVGAPHRRNRIWIVAKSSGVGCIDGKHTITQRHLPPNDRLSKKGKPQRVGRFGRACAPVETFANTDSKQCAETRLSIRDIESGGIRDDTIGSAGIFARFPASPGLYRRNDGIPGEVDEVESRVKALGNAIVPQIAYEIFKAIETSSLHPEAEAPLPLNTVIGD